MKSCRLILVTDGYLSCDKQLQIASSDTPPSMLQGLLTSASKHEGTYRYNFATVPFLAELLKLVISSVLLQRQKQTNPGTCLHRVVPRKCSWPIIGCWLA